MKVARCKSPRCEVSIVWCETENGKRMPVDEEASPDGSFRIVEDASDVPRAMFVKPSERWQHKDQLHTSHFSTCVDAASFKTAKKGGGNV